MAASVNIVWFKRDLRVHDHTPLAEAAKAGHVIPLYIIEPQLWALPDSSRRHWHFIHDSLCDLQRDSAALGAPLMVRIGEATEVLEQLRYDLGNFTLWSHEETGNGWTYARDRAVAGWCRSHNIIWHERPSNGVVRRLTSRDGWATMRDNRMSAPIMASPLLTAVPFCASAELPAKNHPMFGSMNIGTVQSGGRKEALKTLESFLKERGRNYMQSISKPGFSARHCSRLSAHITFGTLSLREVEQATKAKMRTLAGIHDSDAESFMRNLSAFLSRLAWHCHFIQKLEQQPDIEFRCMHPAFEGMREPYFREDWFAAWNTGTTGYPLVDACMRSLHANGWITFRMRAMLVSFASYDLWLDWRKTAPFLAQLFTDYEAGIHYSQFHMQSGITGINAVRMYNPIKQSIDHDPQGKFIRRYVPELKHVPDNFIHQPWRMETPPPHYPPPIVDHEVAIRHARAEISKRWKQDGFKEVSHTVNQKLGSRNRPLPRTKATKNNGIQQLSMDL
ncbi:MAG: deoxyribodipyrimidine photo-lyase [Alphaproteobacteria bacterium]|nr:MAG: deoxyribodipyrimidine photo-lyase [Alphaproteobacteria bacterium]